MTRQCLYRHIENVKILNTELTAWQTAVNNDQRQVNWHFTTTPGPDTRTQSIGKKVDWATG